MDPVFQQLLILMVVVWTMAVLLRRIGLPTIMGELLMGVLLGPAMLGWVEPSRIIEIMAELGIFFLMLHTGVQTEPGDFFKALRSSLGVAIVGAIAPFSVSMPVALAFRLPLVSALFVGLTMTATAVVITIKILQELRLDKTRMARVIVASCVLDDLLTLILFSVVLGMLKTGSASLTSLLWIATKATLFFTVVIAAGYWLYPLLRHPFRDRQGKGFTFVLILGLAFGLFAQSIGLHIILGAYLAGLFFREEVASRELIQKVEDRLYAIAYGFLGPIFFISLGFHVKLDALTGSGFSMIAALAAAVTVSQIASAGGMAKLLAFDRWESLIVGVGMCGRAEMAFVLASLGLSSGAIDEATFSILIGVTFLLNLFMPVGLKACALKLRSSEPAPAGA